MSKQQLNTSNKQYATNENLVGNPVFIKEETSCLAIFYAYRLYEIGPCLLTNLGFTSRLASPCAAIVLHLYDSVFHNS